jgi:predicted O-methyltransferase YrrM
MTMRGTILQKLISRTFLFWQRFGIHVRLNHFYEPIPDTRRFRDLWSKPSQMVGVHIDADCQLELLSRFATLKSEYDALPRQRTQVAHQYFVENGAFESVDGEVLYCMIRDFKPKRVVEIGSGSSSLLAAQAIRANGDAHPCDLTCIEPYPNELLQKGFPGLTQLLRTEVQDVPLETFATLEANDILFIDSSHVLKTGGDVQYEYLEILPRLNKGVLVHVHDIFLPAEYPKRWLTEGHRFWTEQYLLQAFLAFNDRFEIIWAGSYMHLYHPDALERAFGSYRRERTWPGSFWMRRVK